MLIKFQVDYIFLLDINHIAVGLSHRYVLEIRVLSNYIAY